MATDIPGPKGLPFIGALLDIQDDVPIHSFERLFSIYGPIVKFSIPSRETIAVGSFELFDELCDETRFFKQLGGKLAEGNSGKAPTGLFTAKTEKDEDWGQAHRILMPAFGPLAIENMFDEMHDIASQLVLKWARQGPEHRISASEEFSRLTLDTIALCAMDYRFNSFYQEEPHPFIKAMNNTLGFKNSTDQLGGMLKALVVPGYVESVKKDYAFQLQVSRDLVQFRRDHPSDKKDLLNAMVYGQDPKTGQTMRDELIAANMLTFLIAGHETTSGLLSFAFLQMLKNPSTYFTAQQEVDRVLGKDKLEPRHLSQFEYINAVLRETLRLTPTAPGFGRAVRPENKEVKVFIGNGKYEIPRGQSVTCVIGKIQRDPAVWGDDAEEFKPERMLDGKFEKLPKNAWKPFGTGMRACIGRAFAWQEAVMAVALILQNFDLRLDDPNYEMKVVQALTIKPKDFYIRASLREGITATALQRRLQSSSAGAEVKDENHDSDVKASEDHSAMLILYGSNTGTCQALAQKLASQATQRGFNATIKDMDEMIGTLPKEQPVILVTASYEGLPPDNAARFVAWLESLGVEKSLQDIYYAVFGCGHSDWVSTYQKVPTHVDDMFSRLGATRLASRGMSDASKRDMFGDFDKWTQGTLWPALSTHLDEYMGASSVLPPMPEIELEWSTEDRAQHLQQKVQWARVTESRTLTGDGEPEKHHLEIELPSNVTYSAGDYLAILPLNPEDSINRVMRHFSLPFDAVVTIMKSGSTTLPVNTPVKVSELLRGYVELCQPATRKDIEILVSRMAAGADKAALQSYTDQSLYEIEILDKRVSVLDLIEKHAATNLSFASFLSLLPPLRLRHYSISSSPLAHPKSCTLTFAVLDAPSWSQPPARFRGVTSSYLRALQPGDHVLVSVRSTNRYFRLPTDQEATPVVMICAGSGIAPFRGFVEERATMIREGGRTLAPALLFIGCRDEKKDRLYADEIDEWARLGAVDVRYAHSRTPERSEGCRYVQDRMLRDKEDVAEMWHRGAKFYICGSKDLATGVGEVGRRLIQEGRRAQGKGELSDEEVDRFVGKLRNERFVADIF